MTAVFFVAGEASGDIHGANLIRALRELAPECACEGLGGTRMAAAGMTLHYDLAGEAIMGFTEVAKSLGKIRRLFLETVERLRRNRPDCLVLIDYPGFNIRLARKARQLGIPVVYYIGPQIWAWKKGRLDVLAETVTKMLVILPFEAALYSERGLPCTFVGHPLLDHMANTPVAGRYRDRLTIGLLPGSRAQEIQRLLPIMFGVAQGVAEVHPDARFIVPCVDAARERQIQQAAASEPAARTVEWETAVGGTYETLDAARFCLVASGTATVETALFGVPMVILYRVSPLSYRLARWLIDLPYIGMVNILATRGVVPEFIQGEAVPERILPAALELIGDTPARRRMLEELAAVRASLGGPGASRRAAQEVLAVAQSGNGKLRHGG